MIGQLVGNYKIEEKLGEGGMGAVYKGVDTMLDREVAIKALRPELASQTSVVERFRSEAVTLAKLNHPNIAALYTMFRQGEELYMVLEFVRGETLDSIIQKRGAMSADEMIPVFCQILDGIDHAHELGIVHRDIKPANMMLTEKGTLKVLDFGIARLLGSARMTRAGNIIGTLEYMAPEQVKGQETDARSDIYALGMMLYEVLTGRTPFDTENEFELMKLQTESMPTPPSEINPAIPEAVEAAIMQAIQKDPNERFQTAGEFRETLLDAGYAASGRMRGTTGTHVGRAQSRPSSPAISQPGVNKTSEAKTKISADTKIAAKTKVAAKREAEPKATKLGSPAIDETPATAPEDTTPKATRLGKASAAAATGAATASTDAAKATRLGVANATAGEQRAFVADANASSQAAYAADLNAGNESANSFFSKLTAVHYAGAGLAALVLVGALVAVPLMFSGGGKNEQTTKPTVEAQKPAEKPAIIEMPKSEPPASSVSSAPTTQQQPPAATAPAMDKGLQSLAPGETVKSGDTSSPADSAPKSTAQKPPEKREAAAPPKQAAPKPAAPAKPKQGGGGSARCALTGDC
jgi:serine/threonine protein kinase